MVRVFRAVSIRNMISCIQDHLEEHKDEIKSTSGVRGCIPVVIKHKDGTVYEYMTFDYFQRDYIKGRREGIDYTLSW